MSEANLKSLLAYEQIRDLILSGKKLPGTRLVVAELEAELGLGRGAVREAMMRLDRSGLVQNIPHKGAIVTEPLSLSEIKLLYELRVLLEVRLSVEASKYITEAELSELDRLALGMEELANAGSDYFNLDRKFHFSIYSAAKMPHFCSMVDRYMDVVEVFLNRFPYNIDDCRRVNVEHQTIIAALDAADVATLEEVMTQNVMAGYDFIERIYGR